MRPRYTGQARAKEGKGRSWDKRSCTRRTEHLQEFGPYLSAPNRPDPAPYGPEMSSGISLYQCVHFVFEDCAGDDFPGAFCQQNPKGVSLERYPGLVPSWPRIMEIRI